MRKIANTIKICVTLFMARTFGRYVHSVWDGELDYAKYAWRGKTWAFPTAPQPHSEDTP